MTGQRCSQPFDCGSQFKCFRGFCIPVPECPGDDNGCTAPGSECLEASQPEPLPDPDTPNCGLGDPNTDPYVRKDCVSDCSIFCDEWSKITANLTPDSDLKGCSVDDACSVCRACNETEEANEDAVQAASDYYDLLIDEVETQKQFKIDEYEEGLDELTDVYNQTYGELYDTYQLLQAERNELISQHDEYLDELAQLIAERDSLTDPAEIADKDVEIADKQAQITAIEDEIDVKNDQISENTEARTDLTQEYLDNKEERKDQHEEQIKITDDYLYQLNKEKADKLTFLSRTRGICGDIKLPNRACYCPAYIDKDNGRVVDDSDGRECYLCNVDSGHWEYEPELCSVTCDQCVICDNGDQACASVTKNPSEPGDPCELARKKAVTKCSEVQTVIDCAYPRQICEVKGPLSSASLSWEEKDWRDFQVLRILQTGGDSAVEANGVTAKLRLIAESVSDNTQFLVKVNREGTRVNGTDRTEFATVDGLITINTEDVLSIDGKPKVELTDNSDIKRVGSTVEINVDDVTTQVPFPSYEYTWYADNKQLYLDGDGEIALSNIGEDGEPLGYVHIVTLSSVLELEEILVGMNLQGAIRLVDPSQAEEERPTNEDWVKSDPFGPIIYGNREEIDAEIFISADSSYSTYNAIVVDISSLNEYRPEIEPIAISWVDATTGENVGSGDYLYLANWALQKQYYPIATFINLNGEQQTITGPVSPVIGLTSPPSLDDLSEDPQVSSLELSSLSPKQYDTLEIYGNYNTPNGKSAGPFYSWKSNGDFIFNQVSSSLDITQEMVDTYLSVEVTYFDNYGVPITLYPDGTELVINVQDDPTGWVWILGEPQEGSKLTAIDNIEDKDGIRDQKYIWLLDGIAIDESQYGFLFEGSKNETLLIGPILNSVDRKISVATTWTDYHKNENGEVNEHQIFSDETFPVKKGPVEGNLTLIVESKEYVIPDQFFELDLSVASITEDEEPLQITSILWEIEIERLRGDGTGSSELRFTAGEYRESQSEQGDYDGGMWPYFEEEEPVIEGPLVEDDWNGQAEIDCPDCWDCFERSTYKGKKAPLGSAFHQRCPYPGYPEVSCEESKEDKCKQLCIDYCWRWETTESDGDLPRALDENSKIVESWVSKGVRTFTIETCVEPPPELDCPPRDGGAYQYAVYRLVTPTWDYYECTCSVPVGPRQTIPSKIEYSRTGLSKGPWFLNPEEREFLGWGVDEMAQANNLSWNDPGFDYGDLPFASAYFWPDLGCRWQEYFDSLLPIDCYPRPIRQDLCGGNSKPNPVRMFVVTDSSEVPIKQNLIHGWSAFPFPYNSNQFWINQNTDDYLMPEQLPPTCIGAPELVGVLDLRSVPYSFYSSDEVYQELLAMTSPEGSPDISEQFYGGYSEFDWINSAIHVGDLRPGDIAHPPRPERKKKNTPIPVIVGPRLILHDISVGTRLGEMQSIIPHLSGVKPESWRFTANKGALSPDNVFKINSDGVISLANQSPDPGSYQFEVQARWKDVWSKSFAVGIDLF